MDKDTIDKAHPGYVEIIKNLSSDEALLLIAFTSSSIYPLIDVQVVYKGNIGQNLLLANFSHLHKIVAIKRKDLAPSYLDNLCRLGLLEKPAEFLTTENTYEPLETDEDLEVYRIAIGNTEHKIEYRRYIIRLTTFGKQFVNNVVMEKQ